MTVVYSQPGTRGDLEGGVMAGHTRRAAVYRLMSLKWRLFVPAAVALAALSFSGVASARDVARVRGATPVPVASGKAELRARMNPRQMLRLTLVLQPRRQAALQRFLDQVVDPSSPRFHQFLTFEQWKTRFAPTAKQVAAVGGFARTNGLSVVHRFGNNLAVKVEGNAAAVERAFRLHLNHYQADGRTFYSNDRNPAIPRALAGILKDVQGLNGYVRVHAASRSPDIRGIDRPSYRPGPFVREETLRRSARGSGAAASKTKGVPQICCGIGAASIELPDLFSSEAYALTALRRFSVCCNPVGNPGGTPPETSIAIIGQNKVADSDLTAFFTQYGMAANVVQVGLNDPACCNGEMTLDIEAAAAFGNSFGSFEDTARVFAYEGGGSHLSDLLDAWEEAHSRDQARVASTSFGAYEDRFGGFGNPSISDFSDVINAMTAVGWTLIAASGDHGATDDCNGRTVAFPASNPNVLAAGGTTLTLNNNSGVPRFGGETAWNGPGCGGTTWPGQNLGGGGGGCATTEPAGFWQAIVPSLPCGNKRALPDIALNAGNGEAFFFGVAGGWTSLAGTSIVAPELAGFFAHVNSYLAYLGHICGPTFVGYCAPIGMPNAMIWLMANAGSAANGHNPFYDINDGSCNGGQGDNGFCTGPGYDLATGWGSINMLQLAWGLIDVVTHGVLPEVTFSGPATNNWFNTDKLVLFQVDSPSPEGTIAAVGAAGCTAQWDAAVADVRSHATPGSGDSFYDGPQKTGDCFSEYLSLVAAGPGCHTAHVRGWDNAGQTSDDETYGPVCYDNERPDVFCATPDGAWHATDPSINCGAIDQPSLSGLADPSDLSFQLITSVPAGTETTNAFTNSHLVCDRAGNCATAGPIGGNKVDKKPPSITITAPTNTPYTVNQIIAADYACGDGGSGLATCAGPVASGSPIDTATVGTKTFTVNATDTVANASSQSVGYAVTYRICLQYDSGRLSTGRAYAIKIQLCDATNTNVSKASVVLTATGVDGVAAAAVPLGSLNPGNRFLYGPGTAPGASYLYNLDTQKLSKGAHFLNFTVQGDPLPHAVPFLLKK